MTLRDSKFRLLILAVATAGVAASAGSKALATTDDDTQTLQSLILAAQGGTCQLPSKTFNVSATIFIPSNTRVAGMNEDTTIIKAISGFHGSVVSFGTPNKGASSNSSLIQVTVDGNATAADSECTGGPAIYCPPGSSMITVANDEVRNSGLNGLGLHGKGTSTSAFAASVHDCYIHDNYCNGINVAGTVPSTCNGKLSPYVTQVTPTEFNLIARNTIRNNDKAGTGFHAINVGDIAVFTTVSGNSIAKSSSGTMDDNDINVYDDGKYDSYLAGTVQPPLVPQGNRVVNNTLDGLSNPSGGHFDGIKVNGYELTLQVDGNSF